MTLIGCRCNHGDVFSRAVLIARTLSWSASFKKNKEKVEPPQAQPKGKTPYRFQRLKERFFATRLKAF